MVDCDVHLFGVIRLELEIFDHVYNKIVPWCCDTSYLLIVTVDPIIEE